MNRILLLPLTLISFLPFRALQVLSNLTYFLIFHVMGYRKKVVWENLQRSFPEKTHDDIVKIQKKFYQNFCDLIFETIKTSSISREEVKERCRCENPELVRQLFASGVNVAGISSHMGNWEWLSLSLSMESDYEFLAVYKPLSNKRLNEMVIESRQRFGAKFTAIKALKAALDQPHERPYFVGLLSDQAPHDYSKAFEFEFLHQKTFYVPGPGILSVQKNLTPLYGWIRRVGRFRYVWNLELLPDSYSSSPLSGEDLQQVQRISKVHAIDREAAVRALKITKYLNDRLEENIRQEPDNWLWTHRRWKSR